MQRLIAFGHSNVPSAEFGVDEGSRVRLWLVRQDMTTTVGEGEAEIQIKAAVNGTINSNGGEDDGDSIAQWTTFEILNDAQPYFDIIGVDDDTRYRVVRKEVFPWLAVDRSQDGAFSRQQRAPADARQSDFGAATPVIFKALAGTSGDLVGIHFDYQSDDVDVFGNVLGTPPNLAIDPSTNSYIKFHRDAVTDEFTFEIFEDLGAGNSNIDWSEYEGGQVGIATECTSDGNFNSTSWNISALNISDTGITLVVPSGGTPPVDSWLAEEKTFFVFLMKPGQSYPLFNLGAKTGRFTLDRNDVPARLSASPFDTDDENVALSVVEGNTVFPMIEDGVQRVLDVSNTTTSLADPGEYEWRRSCNSAPGVWLNTGWRA